MSEEPVNFFSPGEMRALLESEGIALKRRWGQNFLIDRNVRDKLVDLVEAEPGSGIWEIGPGAGSLTAGLLERGYRVTAFEVDWGLVRLLRRLFAEQEQAERLRIVPGDFLKTWRSVWQERGSPAGLIGNLPYRSGQAILGDVLERGLGSPQIVVTVQREIADRMVAPPNTREYSSFSVLVQLAAIVTRHFDIGRGCFMPSPEVTSSVCELRPTREPFEAGGDGRLAATMRIVRACFHSRRKTIWNNLAGSQLFRDASSCRIRRALEHAGVSPGQRAEELSPRSFLALARALGG